MDDLLDTQDQDSDAGDTEIVVSPQNTLALPEVENMMSFLDLKRISEGLDAQCYTLDSELRTLVGIAQNGKQDRDRINATKQIRQIITDSMRLSGQLAVATARSVQSFDSQGNSSVHRVVEMRRIVTDMKNSESILRQAMFPTPDSREPQPLLEGAPDERNDARPRSDGPGGVPETAGNQDGERQPEPRPQTEDHQSPPA